MKKLLLCLIVMLFTLSVISQDILKGNIKRDKKGKIKLITNINIKYGTGTLEEKAMKFVSDNKSLFDLSGDENLIIIKKSKNLSSEILAFEQLHKGIPIKNAISVFTFDINKDIIAFSNGILPNVKILTKAVIDKKNAIEIANEELGTINTQKRKSDEAKLYIWKDKKSYLIWEVDIILEFDHWLCYVDAHTGEVLKTASILAGITGSGKVFNPDPGTYLQNYTLPDNNDSNYPQLTSSYKNINLQGLNSAVGGYYYLRGEYAYSENIADPADDPVKETNPNFNYNRNQIGFEEANCYYHIDNMIRYVHSLGFSPTWNNSTTNNDYDMVFDARVYLDSNAFYDPYDEEMQFGINGKDAGEDQTVIIHELGHGLHDALLSGGWDGVLMEPKAIGEGIAEYLGNSYRRQLSYYRPNDRMNWLRPYQGISIVNETVGDLSTWPDWSTFISFVPYRNMFASALMNLEYNVATNPSDGVNLGRDVVTTILLASLPSLTINSTHDDYVDMFLQKDISEFNGAHLPEILTVYTNRNLFDRVYSNNISLSKTLSDINLIHNNITVSNNATLTNNNSAILALDGNLTINSGSTFLLKDNSSVYAYNNKQIIINGIMEIESGALVSFHRQANITVNSGGKLVINGNINVGENCSLLISGAGKIIFNGDIEAEPGSSITIQGVSQSITLAEVNSKIDFDTDFTNVTIKNGRIQMNNGNSELYLYSGIDNVTIDNIKITAYYGNYNAHDGLDIASKGTVNVSNSIFEDGYYGLYTNRNSASTNININNCTFRDNIYGLRVYNAGYSLSNSSSYNNTYGVYASSIDLASSMTYCYIYDNEVNNSGYGIYHEGSSIGDLLMTFTTMYGNYNGIFVSGFLTFDMNCSSSTGSNTYSVQAYNNATLDIDNSNLSGSKYAIYGNGASNSWKYNIFYLNDGYNNLNDNGVSGSYCMYGNFHGYTDGTVIVNNNYWKSSGGAPIRNTDYNLSGSNYYLTLSDASPESTFSPCYYPSQSRSISPLDFSTANNDYRNVNISLGKLPLNEAVVKILNNNLENGHVFSDYERFELLDELLANDFKDLNKYEKLMVKYSYGAFKSIISKSTIEFKQEKQVYKTIIKTIRKLNKEIEKSDTKETKQEESTRLAAEFGYLIDEATMLAYSGEYDEAINIVASSLDKFYDDDICALKIFMCKLEVEYLAQQQEFFENEEELANKCSCSTVRKSGSINDNNSKRNIPTSNSIIENIELNIVPNPVTSSSHIQVKGLKKDAILLIYNSMGNVKLNETINSNLNSIEISNTQFNAGIYLVTINQNGKAVISKKMMIIE